MARNKVRRTPELDQLFQALLSLKNEEECCTFLGDLFTTQELASFAQRLQIARLLSEGMTYEKIRQQIPVSSTTITRINTELQYGSGGYQLVLERIAPAEPAPEE